MEEIIIDNNSEYFNYLMELIASRVDKIGCYHSHESLIDSLNIISKESNIDIDSKRTIDFMKSNGGYCDCEILLSTACLFDEEYMDELEDDFNKNK